MYEDFFAERLASLRMAQNVSAREMSLAIGQNGSYINRIENRQAFPSMQAFFYICEYLGISPKDFFDVEIKNPLKKSELEKIIPTLSDEQMNILLVVAKGLSSDKPFS